MSNITWYTPQSIIIKSDNLTTIYGNNPNYNVAVSKIESPALQSIDLIKLPNAKNLNYAFGLCTSLGNINSDISLTQAINLSGMLLNP